MNIDVLNFDVQGAQFAGVGYGPCNGTPVLALHGWLDNAASFCRLAPLLSVILPCSFAFFGWALFTFLHVYGTGRMGSCQEYGNEQSCVRVRGTHQGVVETPSDSSVFPALPGCNGGGG